MEEQNTHDNYVKGVYRLSVRNPLTNVVQNTQCIPYNATAEELTSILDQVSLIYERGSVTIRRYGSANDVRYQYGYTYRIELDSPATKDFNEGD